MAIPYHKYHKNIILILFRYPPKYLQLVLIKKNWSIAKKLSKNHPNILHELSKWCSNIEQIWNITCPILSNCWKILSKHCQKIFQISPKNCKNMLRLLTKCHKILFIICLNIVQNNVYRLSKDSNIIQISKQNFPNIFHTLFKYYQNFVQIIGYTLSIYCSNNAHIVPK